MRTILRNIFVFLLLFYSLPRLNAQENTCKCATDLEFLNSKIKKTPAYKLNKEAYENQLLNTKKQLENISSDYACFVQLNKLMLSLNDNHSRIYSADAGASQEIRNDSIAFAEFKKSTLFNAFPKPKLDLDSLKNNLSAHPHNAIEGIYSRPDFMTLGVFKKPNDTIYNVIVLKSNNKLWETGEVLYTLIPFGNNYLLAIGGSLGTKRMVAHTERIENGIFLTTAFQKDPAQPNHTMSIHPEDTYLREEISPEITYLKIGSFNSWNPTLSEAETFYKTLNGTLTKEHLIVDLRDNGGGGNRNSKFLFDILKDYSKNNSVYVLVNNRTFSNAEQFAFKLSKLENCTILGNRTNGTAAYEIVDGSYKLPCGKFIAVLTSKKHSKFLEIESVGVEPDVKLGPETDWILQLQEYIQSKK